MRQARAGRCDAFVDQPFTSRSPSARACFAASACHVAATRRPRRHRARRTCAPCTRRVHDDLCRSKAGSRFGTTRTSTGPGAEPVRLGGVGTSARAAETGTRRSSASVGSRSSCNGARTAEPVGAGRREPRQRAERGQSKIQSSGCDDSPRGRADESIGRGKTIVVACESAELEQVGR